MATVLVVDDEPIVRDVVRYLTLELAEARLGPLQPARERAPAHTRRRLGRRSGASGRARFSFTLHAAA
jgi:hypothetical protein